MHTPSCHSFRVQIELERHWYHIAYPTHCSECDGAGGWRYSDDPSNSGVSLSPGSMAYFEPCDDCFLKNRCPRCGESLEYIEPDRFGPDLPSDFVLCRSCGWDEFNSASKGMMQHHECYCWEIVMKDIRDVLPCDAGHEGSPEGSPYYLGCNGIPLPIAITNGVHEAVEWRNQWASIATESAKEYCGFDGNNFIGGA